ncbi:hypothetical protein [Cellulomonas xiejunii]|uniref:hypothetical protein n=1 Tax=Cellulomonas xiejunii TaxID=2968083 RepID=UPI001D0EBB18|nr:hypothetical protein [Cellulomonas xiejunii]MCC2313558.1 hypothetical protein [Cellulomonas xiejunii]
MTVGRSVPAAGPDTLGRYLYISDRLVADVVGVPPVRIEHRPLTPVVQRVGIKGSVGDYGAEITTELGQREQSDPIPELGPRVDMAVRATSALREAGEIGSLLQEPVPQHVLLRMSGVLSVMPLSAAEQLPPDDQMLVMFGSSGRLADGRRALVILLGSEWNLLTSPNKNAAGQARRPPSDLSSLFQIFDERKGLRRRAPLADGSPASNQTEGMIRAAAELYFARDGDPARQVVALVDAHTVGSHFGFGPAKGEFDVVVVGAALWMREVHRSVSPAPRVDAGQFDEQFGELRRAVLVQWAAHARTVSTRREQHAQIEGHLGTLRGQVLRQRLAGMQAVAWHAEGERDMDLLLWSAHQLRAQADAAIAAVESIQELEGQRGTLAAQQKWERSRVVDAENAVADAVVAKREQMWAPFAQWFVAQAVREGAPLVRLDVDRRRSVPVPGRPRTKQETTNILGVVVYLPAVTASEQLARSVLVTPEGAVYSVTVEDRLRVPDGFGWKKVDVDLTVPRIVYSPLGGGEEPLLADERPALDATLVPRAARAMFARAVLAQRAELGENLAALAPGGEEPPESGGGELELAEQEGEAV